MENTISKNKLPRWVIPAGIAAVILIGILGIWGAVNSIRNEAIRYETTLSAEYQANQNHLSAFISEFKETVGIADRKTDQLDRVLANAVTGRYGEDGFSANGALFSAITEAYPDLRGLDTYDKVIDTIRAGRADFKNRQDGLLDKLRAYDNWRKQGIFRSWALGQWAPSDNLVARVGDQRLTGPEALEKMYDIVLIGDATRAYETGEMEALQAPPLPARPAN